MRFTLPIAPTPDAPDVDVLLSTENCGSIELRFRYVSDDLNPITVALTWVHGGGGAYLAHGEGSTPAEALLDLLSDRDGWLEDNFLSVAAATALDELAHQSVRIVCDRLCGGELDSATFAEPHLLDTQSGQVEEGEDVFETALIQILQKSRPVIGLCDEKTLDSIEQKFLKLLAEEEPDHPWVCKLRTPREGDHPRSKEHVLR